MLRLKRENLENRANARLIRLCNSPGELADSFKVSRIYQNILKNIAQEVMIFGKKGSLWRLAKKARQARGPRQINQ